MFLKFTSAQSWQNKDFHLTKLCRFSRERTIISNNFSSARIEENLNCITKQGLKIAVDDGKAVHKISKQIKRF